MQTISEYLIELQTIYNKVTNDYCWVHTRGAVIPGEKPVAVATTQQWAMGQSDIFSEIHHMRSDDFGKSWTEPKKNMNLGRRQYTEGIEIGVCDFYPAYHESSRAVLATGHTVCYDGGAHPASVDRNIRIYPAYSVYDEINDTWTDWKIIDLDEKDFYRCSAGCAQRYDLDDGTFILPVSHSAKGEPYTRMTVLHCSFDGKDITVLNKGNTLTVDSKRGLAEGSITRYMGKFYLTMRHDLKGYVSVSDDGLHYSEPETWKWDTGIDVETYNTQTHWISCRSGLYLTYTRNAGNNSHVFRHRAPLFMARVDEESCRILRHTERIVIPERGARLGNFSTVNASESESWIFNTEVLSPPECTEYGCDGSIYLARIKWSKP